MGAGPAGDRASQELEGLPPCAPADARRAGEWKDVDTGRGFAISLPACFEPKVDPGAFYVHGGQSWRCETRTADVVWGMWGASSFSDSWTLCATRIGGVPAMIGRKEPAGGPVEMLAWYLTGTVHEPVVSGWSKEPARLQELQAIVYSGKKK